VANPITPERRQAIDEKMERYLWALVRAEIRGERAPRQAAADECGISVKSGSNYRAKNADRYFEIRGECSRELRSRVAAEQESLVVAYSKAEADALARIQRHLDDDTFEPRELALVSKNLGVSKVNANTVSRQARGEDVVRVEHSADDILKSLAALMPAILPQFVEGTVEEIPEGTVEA